MGLTLQWIGQGGYILDDGETRVCIDPYLSDIVERMEGLVRMVDAPYQPQELNCDLIVTTHDHIDHLDPDSVVLMDRFMAFAGPTSCKQHLAELGFLNCAQLNVNDTLCIGHFELTGVFADHTEDSIGVILRHDDYCIYFGGDTLYHERLKEIQQFHPDVMVICINGKMGNMTVQEAVSLTKAIAPKVAIPSHYGMFAENTEDPALFTEALAGSGVRALELQHTQTISVDQIL